MVSYPPPTEPANSIATIGYSTQRTRPTRLRRTWTNIHTLSASAIGGHTQPASVMASSPGLVTNSMTPANAMTAAGTNAHRCGWVVRRADSTASIAQPAANATRAEPVMTYSRPPVKTTNTSRSANTRPVAIDPTTTLHIGPRWGSTSGTVGSSRMVVMDRMVDLRR